VRDEKVCVFIFLEKFYDKISAEWLVVFRGLQIPPRRNIGKSKKEKRHEFFFVERQRASRLH
jgi:hypothetical protein